MDEVFVVTIVFGTVFLAIVTIVNHVMRLWRTAIFHRTLRDAIASGSDAVAPMIAEGLEPKEQPRGDGRIATILVAIALALFAYGAVQGHPDVFREVAGAAMFPLFIGAALFIREYWLSRRGPVDA